MEDKKVSITLSLGEWNYVLSAIAQRPYAEVVKLVGDIKEQANAQLNQPETAEE